MARIAEDSGSIPALIYAAYEANKDKPRSHLGASLLGHKCARYLWLSFRWAISKNTPGRVLRLFERGQREEEIFVKNLRAIGVDIRNTCIDQEGQANLDFGNHVKGSVDGIIYSGVPGAPKKKHIAEFKTHSLKSFNDLKKNGLKKSKPMHWAQMQCYMHGTQIDRGLYLAVCKDNDELYAERVEYDKEIAVKLIDRGHRIVSSEELPPRISNNPSWYECKMCPAWSFCFETHLCKEVNCRTCAHFTARPDGSCVCEYLTAVENKPCPLPYSEQFEGCCFHAMHPTLAPAWKLKGVKIPAGLKKWEYGIVYEIDGHEVINGGEKEQISTSRLLAGDYDNSDDCGAPF